jgi:hypothetical protein
LQRRVREMHEVNMTLDRVEPLQREVAEAPVPNRKPKGRNFLEKFENTQKVRCC